jgi:hypothetical protein
MEEQRKYLGVVYEGVKDYNGIFGKSCNEALTIGVILLGFMTLVMARHLTKVEGRLRKIEQKLGG